MENEKKAANSNTETEESKETKERRTLENGGSTEEKHDEANHDEGRDPNFEADSSRKLSVRDIIFLNI